MPKPILRKDVIAIADLKPGMILKGTVRNVIDFGAFVDIGVHQDGLVHISQMCSDRRVNHPLDVVSVGDIVDVRVISVEEGKERISLSMILDENEANNKKFVKNPDGSDRKGPAKGDRRNAKDGKRKSFNDRNDGKKSKNEGLDLTSLAKFMK